MCASQIRSLCLKSHKQLMNQLSDVTYLKPSDDEIERLQEETSIEEYYDEIYLDEEVTPVEVAQSDRSDVMEDAKQLELEVKDHKFLVPFAMKSQSKDKHSYEICEQCGKKYTKNYISTHLRTHHGQEKKARKYSCKLVSACVTVDIILVHSFQVMRVVSTSH